MRKENNLKVLKYWLDVEMSSPPIVKINKFNLKNDINFNQLIFSNDSENDLVWSHPLNSKLKNPKGWVHRVYLGIFNTSLIINEFSVDENDVNELKQSHSTCMLSFMLDGNGDYIRNSLVVPSCLKYIYGYVNDNLKKSELDSFDNKITDMFSLWMSSITSNNESINKVHLRKLITELLLFINWDSLNKYFKFENPKYIGYTESITTDSKSNVDFDSGFNNSFISEELSDICDLYSVGGSISALDYYLEEAVPDDDRVDVVEDESDYREYLKPDYMPNVSFPYPDNIRLNLSQQYAVNKIFNVLENRSGIFSVNGPPGTGKTTLFKDIISNIIYLRAEKLFQFRDNPKDCFTKIGDISYRFGDNGEKPIYALNDEITGYEIVVASSNNNAIRNITNELPKKESIDPFYNDKFTYIKRIADNVYDGEDCWGMISATLGNKSNNFDFMNGFLFKTYDDDKLAIKDSIFDFLNRPAYFNERVFSWEKSCDFFEKSREQLLLYKNQIIKISKSINDYESTLSLHKDMLSFYNEIKIDLEKYKSDYRIAKRDYDAVRMKLMKKQSDYRKSSSNQLKDEIRDLNLELATYKQKVLEIKDGYSILKSDHKEIYDVIKVNIKNIQQMKKIKEKFSKGSNDYPDESFWKKSEDFKQKSSVWLNRRLIRCRKNLFIASMNLHKSFIVENSSYIISNLRTLKDILEDDFFEKEIYTRSILQTLFITVPVLSTTLNSFSKMFSSFGVGGIGWLLIDEAGQSSPQLPVASLYHSKRAIFCGDPMQIQPVVSIEKKLSDVLIKKNEISNLWNSYNYSAQQIADRNSYFGTYFGYGEHRKWFGAPLRVHKRCQDPMFSISNKIAYDNKMIYDTNKDGDFKSLLGDSAWFHIESEVDENSNTHYIEEEVEFLTKALKILFKGATKNNIPDVFIISPFRDVVYSSQRYLINMQRFIAPKVDSKVFINWVKKSVGTIHTFQGKEADVVFLIIGGNKNKRGAISWLATDPNMLNVSVTRARKRFYIIGNAKVWNLGVFRVIREYMKIRRIKQKK